MVVRMLFRFPVSDRFVYAGRRISAQLLCRKATPRANIPAAVTMLLFSLLVKAEMVLEAKLGS